LKGPSEDNESSSELEQKALYYSLSQYLLEDMISNNDPMVFLGSVLIKFKELFGGIPAIGIKRSPGIWDRLILDKTTKAAHWVPSDPSKSIIYESIGECDYISYSETTPSVNHCTKSVLDAIKSCGLNNITVIPVKLIQGMVLELVDLPVPDKIPRYVTGIEGFMIPLILSLKQVLLLDESKKLENESKLLSHILVHDIRNFLNVLEASHYILSHENKTDLHSNETIALAKSSLEDAKKLIERVGKALSASVTTNLSKTNLRHVIEDCISIVASQRKKIELDIKIFESTSPTKPYVLADDRLSDIYLNLFDNAIDNTEQEKKWIQIEWRPWVTNPSFLHIRIKDRGPGVPDSVIKNISGRYRIQSAKGLGLGLSIVARLVERYNGSFWFEKRVENDVIQGSTANIVLTLSE